MFKKILIAEDIDSIQDSVINQVKQLTNAEVHHSKYCDEAFLKIKKANLDGVPYDLLISDLSFAQDHRDAILNGGEELIKAVRDTQLHLKIIIYSIEDKTFKIKTLFEKLHINGFVSKGRYGSVELEKAIISLSKNDTDFIDSKALQAIKNSKTIEIEDYDLRLISYLSQGLTQAEIVEIFKKETKVPSSNSTIEKRLNKLKIYFKVKNTVHLISTAKDMGLI